jgi:glyoxylase-like metal-dependent hydrolase (beta-lactamase superfamily II)
MSKLPIVKAFFDEDSHTFSYVVHDVTTGVCAVIDSVLNFDAASGCTSSRHADLIIDYIQAEQLKLQWILETHVHADHLSAAQFLKSKLGGQIAISQHIVEVQDAFAQIYDLDSKIFNLNQPFDYLFDDHESFTIGSLNACNIPTPGHTPACLSYVVGDAVFVGDTLFMPDYGTARCDFPKGSAEMLFDSIQKLYELPDQTRVFLCHDYLPAQRSIFVSETDIYTQKTQNIHVRLDTLKAEFVEMRNARDRLLSMPKLIWVAIQVNMNAGHFPKPAANGVTYLKLPINYLL